MALGRSISTCGSSDGALGQRTRCRPFSMQLVGMLDSPNVRRVAITLQLLGLRFAHQSISVFSAFAQFQQINPVVKAPSLVYSDGEVLMDSTLIIESAEALAAPSSRQQQSCCQSSKL